MDINFDVSFLGAYEEHLLTQTGLDKAQINNVSLRLEQFSDWLSDNPELDLEELGDAYRTYLATELQKAKSTVDAYMADVDAYLSWVFDTQEYQIPSSNKDYVVGIGASAGGLEALERFFGSSDISPLLSYVVIQHLSPDFKSMMPEILARVTDLPIHSIEDGMSIQPGHIYLNNPRSDVRIKGRVLSQEARADENVLHLPINTFLKSLAFNQGEKAIAIILSGTGRDGSLGVSEVHEQGGLVIVQDAKSALYSSMPQTAAAQGPAHLVLDPANMPKAIDDYINHEGVSLGSDDSESLTGENAFSYLLSLLQRAYGIDFNYYKDATLIRRLERRMDLGGFTSLERFVSKLQEDNEELDALYRDMLVDVTSFFRNTEAFDLLKNEVIPQLVANKKDGEYLRVWVAACASGEEAYSVAMLFDQEISKQKKRLELKVFATDAHKASIMRASIGNFDAGKLEAIPDSLVEKYFVKEEGHYKINKSLRQKIIFAPHDILSDGNFSNIDFLSCRNMLIYLKSDAQEQAIRQFSHGLNDEGILFLGSSEHLGTLKSYYEVISEKWRIYRKLRDMPVPQHHLQRVVSPSFTRSQRARSSTRQGWERQLLKHFAPNGFVIDAEGHLVEIIGDAKKYTQLRAGRIDFQLSSLLVEPLATTIKSGFYSVTRKQEAFLLQGVEGLKNDDGLLNITFVPIDFTEKDAVVRYYFIGIEKNQEKIKNPVNVENVDSNLMVGLERELEFTRESLQASLQEVETTNEELQSTNEELIASNEELQSTNEELSSVNEELITVNAEYQSQNKRLNQVNNDLENLLKNSETLAIFLNEDLRIRMITPYAYDVFDLMETDIGRPISYFAPFISFGEAVIKEMCQTALAGERSSTLVSLENQRQFRLSVIPYETPENGIDGVVLRFIDVTSTVKEAEAPLKEHLALLERLGQSFPTCLYSYNVAIDEANYLAGNLFFALGFELGDIFPDTQTFRQNVHIDDMAELDKHMQRLNESKEGETLSIRYRYSSPAGDWIWLESSDTVYERTSEGDLKTIVGNIRSVELENNIARYSLYSSALFELSPDCLKIIDNEGRLDMMNLNGCKLMDIDDFGKVKGQPWAELWPEPDIITQALEKARETGQAQFEALCPTAKGIPKWWTVDVKQITLPDSGETAFLSSSRDITELKQRAQELEEDNLELEARLQAIERLTDHNPSVMYVYDIQQDRNVYATGNIFELIGYSIDELRAHGDKLLMKLMHPDDIVFLQEHHQALQEQEDGKILSLDYRLKHKHGHWEHLRSLDAVYKRDKNNKVEQILGHVVRLK